MTENFSNEYQTQLNGAIDDDDTTLVVDSDTGSPDVNFRIKIDDEYMLVTGKASTTFTVTRGVEGSTPAAHSDNAVVTHVLTAGALNEFFDVIRANFGEGLAATFVGSDTAGGGLTITLDKPMISNGAPLDTQDGDLVILCVGGHNVTPNAAGPAAGGGAWTERLRFDTDGNEWIACYTKIAASEGSTWSITTNSSSTTLSGACVVVLRGPSTFVRQQYTDGSLNTFPITGSPNGLLIAVWLSALAAGTLFSVSTLTQHLAYRVASGEPAFLIGSTPSTTAFSQNAHAASAAGISGTWLGNLVMIWE
jgi:hypothetical protein